MSMNGINELQLRSLVIKPTLESMPYPYDDQEESTSYSEVAEDLITGTIAHESLGGHYVKQVGSGPALGIIQMEPVTFWDHMQFLRVRARNSMIWSQMHDVVIGYSFEEHKIKPEDLLQSLPLNIVMARLHYLTRAPEPLPDPLNDHPTKKDYINSLADYWLRFYNTRTDDRDSLIPQFVDHYIEYTSGGD